MGKENGKGAGLYKLLITDDDRKPFTLYFSEAYWEEYTKAIHEWQERELRMLNMIYKKKLMCLNIKHIEIL